MNVLTGCEWSGTVRDAFRRAGHNAWSCDLLPSEGVRRWNRYHYREDIRVVIALPRPRWDVAIVFPDCTYLAGSGLHWNGRIPGRAQKTEDAVLFVLELWTAKVPKLALENPVGLLSRPENLGKPTQIIQPYDFGHDARKATCLWLRGGLAPLVPTCRIPGRYACPCGGARFVHTLGKYGCPNCGGDAGPARLVWGNQTASGQNRLTPSPTRAKERGRTYPGIADAMAQRWGVHA